MNEPMLICCVKEGPLYSVDYVNILLAMIFRNTSKEFRFLCFTDDAQGLSHRADAMPLPLELKGAGWFNKLYLFKDGLFKRGQQIFYFDLDTMITGSLDEIFDYRGDFCILRDFLHLGSKYGSGVMSWQSGEVAHIWNNYQAAGYPRVDGGDQNWIEQQVQRADFWQDEFPSEFVSWKVYCRGGVPKDAKVVCFHGKPKPHELGDETIKTHWNKEFLQLK